MMDGLWTVTLVARKQDGQEVLRLRLELAWYQVSRIMSYLLTYLSA